MTELRSLRFALLAGIALIALIVVSAPFAEAAQPLHGHVPAAVSNSRLLRRMPAETRLNLAIGLPLRNSDALDSLIERLSDSASADYRRYLTPQQFADQFGPAESDYDALIAFVQSRGLTVTATHTNRMLLDVSGDIADVEAAFHVRMMLYEHPVRGQFYAPDREPSVDLDIGALDIAGLDNKRDSSSDGPENTSAF